MGVTAFERTLFMGKAKEVVASKREKRSEYVEVERGRVSRPEFRIDLALAPIGPSSGVSGVLFDDNAAAP